MIDECFVFVPAPPGLRTHVFSSSLSFPSLISATGETSSLAMLLFKLFALIKAGRDASMLVRSCPGLTGAVIEALHQQDPSISCFLPSLPREEAA